MQSIIIVMAYLFLQMSLMWGLYRILKNPSVVDVSWSLGLMVSGLIYLHSTPLTVRTTLISLLLILWALRLALYLWYTRIRKGHVDKRYLELSTSWKISQSLGFFLNFQLQAVLILIISMVFYPISKSPLNQFSFLDYIAMGIILIGIFGESMADLQLQRFKSEFKGQVCNLGLWHYCRHPNYFFDWLSWVGFAVFGLQAPLGFLALLAPLLLYIIFNYMTGPLTEKGSIQSRGQKYIDYQKQTPMFFPRIKIKNFFG